MDFTNKVAISTGAASGMGLLFCREFIKNGGKAVLVDINEEVTITASDGIRNVDDFVTTELIDAIDTLKMLFDTNEISCKFFADKIMLSINNYENLFELGGLFSSPLNKKVSEKFISQISGLLLFLDYISTNFKVNKD